jgi:PAS domain S-box-containing protein
MRILLPVAILLAGILITGAVSQLVRQQEEDKLRIEFDLLVEQTAKVIQDRIKAHEQVLRGVVGLFSAARQSGKPVTRAEFRSFVAALHLDERYPGIQGVGFSRLIQPEQLGDHLRAIRAEGFPLYSLQPPGERKYFSSIIYLEPFDWRNQRAFGYDMYAEPVRQRAMERAWKSGSAALSGRVTLVQETDKEVQPGALLYLPVFREGTTPTTDSLRLDNLIGWVYSPLRMKDMMSGVLERNLRNIGGRLALSLHDGDTARPETLLFSMESLNAGAQNGLRASRTLEVAGQQWLLTASAQPGFGWEERGARAQGVLSTGLLISLLLAAISIILQRSAARNAVSLERLAESEQHFRTLADNGTALIWTSGLDRLCTYFNAPWLRFTGRALEQELGNGWTEGVHPEDFDLCLQTYVTAFDQRQAFSMDYRLRHASGEYRWIRDDGVPRYDSEGSFIGYIGHCFDIDQARKMETRLVESEQRFQAMFNGSPDGVLTAEIETQQFIAANPSMARLLGYEINELLEMKTPEIHPQDQLQAITELFGTMARGEAATASGVPMLCKDGRILYADLAVSLHECDGHPCMTGFFRDVTAQKRMTAELDAHRSQLERLIAERTDQIARQKFFLEDLIATLPCGVFRLRHKAPATAAEWADVEHPPHVQDLSSDTYCRLLGISREDAEASQGGVIARIHPDDLDEFLRRVEQSNTALTPFAWEGRMHVGGETRWMRFDAIPRQIDDEIVVSGIVQNIDEQRKHSTLIYRSVIEATPDAFVAIDEASRIIEWSAQAEKMFGYSAAEAIGMQLRDAIIPASLAAEHDYHLKQFVASGRGGAIGKRRRVTARRRNGSEFPVELQIMALHLEEHWRFTSFIRDISDVVAAEQRLAQAQKLEAIGQLTGGLAHDFNNLLGIVVGNLELMQEGVSPDEADELINAALSAASRGVGVTRSLLAVARRSSPMPMDTNINVLLGELEPLLRQTAGRRSNVLMTAHAEHAHSLIDSSAFSNALLNLVINARDAMPNGGGDLLIYSYSMYVELPRADDIDRVDLPEGLYVVVGVDDQGCGMDPDTVKKAFEPFFTTKKHGKGTGLGLPMVHAFATQSGGTVRIESTPGKGCSVQIILPAKHGKDENKQADPPSAGAEGGSANGRLLLVDDEADLLKITGRWLTKLGYQVDTAENAEAALAILASRKFDLLLTDIVMPGEMDGLALARIAAGRFPEMKIILLSGYPENITDDDRRRWALLEKPVSRAALTEELAAALGTRGRSEH